jgi:hypothetical protein
MSTSLFNHALKVYNEMRKEAKRTTIEGVRVHVYEGRITYLYQGLGLSQTYYSSIFKGLERMGSVTKLSRGGRGGVTRYVLHRPPDFDSWQEVSKKPLTPPQDFAILAQRVEDLAKRLGGLDIGEALLDFETRLQRVEEKVGVGNGKN